MGNYLEMTGRQLHQNIRNLRFVLAVVLCVLTCMLPTIFYSDGSIYRTNSILNLYIMGGFEDFAIDSIEFSSIAIINNFFNSPWFSMLILAICAFPAVSLFADEYYSGVIYFTLSGSSVICYSVVKFIAAALSGGFVFLFAFVIYVMLIIWRFPGIWEYSAEIIQGYQMIYANTDILHMIGLAFHMMVVSMLCVSVVMMLSTFLRDRYFLFGLPMLVVFFMERMSMYMGSIYMEIYDSGKGWWMVFVPSFYSGFYQNFEWNVGLPYIFFLFVALAEIIVMFFVFYKQVGRRVRCNA